MVASILFFVSMIFADSRYIIEVAGKMVQQEKTLISRPNNPSSIPGIHMVEAEQ